MRAAEKAQVLYDRLHPEKRKVDLNEDPTKPKGVNHDLDLVFLAWEIADAADWRYIPSIQEVAAKQPSWIRDLLYVNAEIRRQLGYIEGEQQAFQDIDNKSKKGR